MVTNCHTQNAQSIITLTKLWWWTVTLRMRNQLLLIWPNYGAELSHPECAINCYYFDQIMVNCHTQNAQSIAITLTKLWSWTVTARMRNQLLLLWPNYGDELSHPECAINCYYFDQISGDELTHSECATNCCYFDQISGDELSHSECVATNCYYFDQISGDELSHSECANNYYFDQISGDELSHSECANNCYYFDQIMVMNC